MISRGVESNCVCKVQKFDDIQPTLPLLQPILSQRTDAEMHPPVRVLIGDPDFGDGPTPGPECSSPMLRTTGHRALSEHRVH